MDEKNTGKSETLRNLELLNQQVSELIKLQRKANTGYEYINAHELAELLGESVKTIYGRVYKKQMPYYKPGGKLLLFKTEEILEWIQSSKHSSIDELRQRL